MSSVRSVIRHLCFSALLCVTIAAGIVPCDAGVAHAGETAKVTFSGFQRGKAGGGTLFVHVSQRAEVAVKGDGNSVTVRLAGAAIDVRNNRHPLDLSHFDVLLVSSRLVEVGTDVELRLELRRPATLDVYWVERKEGLASLHVSIPAT